MKSNIVSIPVKMEKFYGKGTMLHPSIEAEGFTLVCTKSAAIKVEVNEVYSF